MRGTLTTVIIANARKWPEKFMQWELTTVVAAHGNAPMFVVTDDDDCRNMQPMSHCIRWMVTVQAYKYK